MAPMIDMVFLLLVFFMTASAMSQAGSKLEVDLAESDTSEVAKDFSNRLIVSIDKSGTFFVGRGEVSEEELRELLTDYREGNAELKLAIRADRETEYAAVRQVMAVASECGIESYLYATLQGSE